MTDNEIIANLEQIKRGCVLRGSFYTVIENTLSLINRQKAEIERLRVKNSELEYDLDLFKQEKRVVQAEAIKEFADLLKAML